MVYSQRWSLSHQTDVAGVKQVTSKTLNLLWFFFKKKEKKAKRTAGLYALTVLQIIRWLLNN